MSEVLFCIDLSPHKEAKRSLATSAAQVAVSMTKACPFVSSKIGLVKASPQVQEDVHSALPPISEEEVTSGKTAAFTLQ